MNSLFLLAISIASLLLGLFYLLSAKNDIGGHALDYVIDYVLIDLFFGFSFVLIGCTFFIGFILLIKEENH